MSERLYNLLPAIYRQRDLAEGEPLRALLAIIEQELAAVETDVADLYENWFIETCDEWVVPYLGGLLGVRGLSQETNQIVSQRAHVANAIGYRRRKGVTTILERVAEDITGWKARAVEYFNLLGATQHLYHLRLAYGHTFDLRDRSAMTQMNTPFQTAATLVDVRRIAAQRGRPNIPNVGLFLWRWLSYPVSRSTARQVRSGGYTFDALGYDRPLFNRPQPKTELTQRTEAIHVPVPLTRQALANELAKVRAGAKSAYFDPQPVLQLFIDGQLISPEKVAVRDLSDWPAVEQISVDPELGRLALPADQTSAAEIQVSHAYGFSADIGGGPYDRRASLTAPTPETWQAVVSKNAPAAAENQFTDLAAALAAWTASQRPEGLIQILDNSTYDITGLTLELPAQTRLAIEAADGVRPCLTGTLAVAGRGEYARLTLNGLMLDGGIALGFQGNLILQVAHCTLIPAGIWTEASLEIAPGVQVTLTHSLTGPLRLPAGMAGLVARDSIISPGGWSLQTPVLVSGSFSLSADSGLTADTPALNVTIGHSGPQRIVLAEKPTTPTQARDQLQAAIRAAYTGQAFAEAQVILTSSPRRLLILAGVPEPITIEATADDPHTAAELGLAAGQARLTLAAISGSLAPFPTLSSAAPAVQVVVQTDQGRQGRYEIKLADGPTTLAQARDRLQMAIREGQTDPPLADTLAATLDDRLIVVPGAGGQALSFRTTPADPTTGVELGLIDPAAIAAPDRPEMPGPPTTLERVTVFGPVRVQELRLASEVIFTGPVLVQQRQGGSVRFSYVPPGSQTPQRYRCQPDFALAATEADKGRPLTDEERHTIYLHVQPRFTARQYGHPGYGQLSDQCAPEIATGAENGSEMGAFQHLLQPQREANLRNGLEEYLRAGLEAGIFFVN